MVIHICCGLQKTFRNGISYISSIILDSRGTIRPLIARRFEKFKLQLIVLYESVVSEMYAWCHVVQGIILLITLKRRMGDGWGGTCL
jgi:hypothetical protein